MGYKFWKMHFGLVLKQMSRFGTQPVHWVNWILTWAIYFFVVLYLFYLGFSISFLLDVNKLDEFSLKSLLAFTAIDIVLRFFLQNKTALYVSYFISVPNNILVGHFFWNGIFNKVTLIWGAVYIGFLAGSPDKLYQLLIIPISLLPIIAINTSFLQGLKFGLRKSNITRSLLFTIFVVSIFLLWGMFLWMAAFYGYNFLVMIILAIVVFLLINRLLRRQMRRVLYVY